MKNIRDALDGFALFDPNWHSPHIAGRVGLTCTLYFRGGHLPEVRENVYECIREYREILGDRARCCLLPPGRVVRAGKKGLPLLTEEHVLKAQHKGEDSAEYILTSAEELGYRDSEPQPPTPDNLLWTELYLNSPPDFSRSFPCPGVASRVPLDKQISMLFAGFAPSLFLLNEQPLSFVELVLRWTARLRPVSGFAGWGVMYTPDPYLREEVKQCIAPYLLRFPGLSLTDATWLSNFFAGHIATINWLTMINEELAARIGGPEQLASLGRDCPITPYPGGYVIQAGPRPEIGDRNRGEIPLFYRRVHELLRPLHPPQTCLYYLASSLLPPDYVPKDEKTENRQALHAFFEQWMRRFEQPETTDGTA